MVGLQHYLVLSAMLASLGIIAMISRRNAISILMGIELILNAAALNFVAFARFGAGSEATPQLGGHVFSIFIIVLAAAEAAIALAIIIAIYHYRSSINADELQTLKR
ncbi:MAG: NADH-quinone oxidoreductase subunit NuoK [Candidatus Krumholzibacteriia bacterium]